MPSLAILDNTLLWLSPGNFGPIELIKWLYRFLGPLNLLKSSPPRGRELSVEIAGHRGSRNSFIQSPTCLYQCWSPWSWILTPNSFLLGQSSLLLPPFLKIPKSFDVRKEWLRALTSAKFFSKCGCKNTSRPKSTAGNGRNWTLIS